MPLTWVATSVIKALEEASASSVELAHFTVGCSP